MSGADAAKWFDDFLRQWGTMHPVLTPIWLLAIYLWLVKALWR